MKKRNVLGKHVLLELYDCPQSNMNDIESLERQLCQAAEIMGATLVDSRFHQFSPYGVSGVVVIQESHLTIHTWPEFGYAAIDIFTCGDIDMEAGIKFLAVALQSGRMESRLIERGINLPKAKPLPA